MTEDENQLPPAEADRTLQEILGLPPPKDDEPVDWEARSLAFIAEAKKRDAVNRYNADCEKGYPVSDWNHVSLQPYAHAIEQVRGWQFGRKGVIASGPTGRGKTRSIFALYRRLACDESRTVRYWFAGDWFNELQAEIHYGKDDARAFVENCAQIPVVILDDLGQEALTNARADWAASWFFRFLDIRIAKQLPLIVSTNLTSKEIAGRKDGIREEPMMRRLLELADVVKFEAK